MATADLYEVFFKVYAGLHRSGKLQPYEQWNGHLLVALDGTAYFKSQKIHCECCSSRTRKNGRITCFHQAILPVIVDPTQTQVIAPAPEFIPPLIPMPASQTTPFTPTTVPKGVSAGRSRWKTEDENHNVLKTKGYYLEHNFGHGQRHLAASLLILNLLAFLFHTVLHQVDDAYRQIRQKQANSTEAGDLIQSNLSSHQPYPVGVTWITLKTTNTTWEAEWMQQVLVAHEIPARIVSSGVPVHFGCSSPAALQVRVQDRWTALLLLSPLEEEAAECSE